ncbi:MAG: DUF6262 family protein [Legionella sp.]|uniref:DUF6262 family protein n=1 Tax=Legionella sp. TaxID=459 RepID=UPI0039E45C7F
MKTESQIDALKTAAQNKSSETFKRFLEALEIMQKDNIPINVESVAKFANVSKRWIYNNPDLLEQIKNMMRDQAVKLSTKEREIGILSKLNYSGNKMKSLNNNSKLLMLRFTTNLTNRQKSIILSKCFLWLNC